MEQTSGRVRRHPIRGAIWGLIAGLGIALLLIAYNVIALGTLTPYLVIVLTLLAGTVYGRYAPAKPGKEPGAAAPAPPATSEQVEPTDGDSVETAET